MTLWSTLSPPAGAEKVPRHEIIADHMDIRLSQALQRGDVVVDILFPVGRTHLDRVVDIDAFNPQQF